MNKNRRFLKTVRTLVPRLNTNPETVRCEYPNGDHAQLPMSQALRLQSAVFWLKLGEATLALRELNRLPHSTWNHPSFIKTQVAAIGALRKRSEAIVQELPLGL